MISRHQLKVIENAAAKHFGRNDVWLEMNESVSGFFQVDACGARTDDEIVDIFPSARTENEAWTNCIRALRCEFTA